MNKNLIFPQQKLFLWSENHIKWNQIQTQSKAVFLRLHLKTSPLRISLLSPPKQQRILPRLYSPWAKNIRCCYCHPAMGLCVFPFQMTMESCFTARCCWLPFHRPGQFLLPGFSLLTRSHQNFFSWRLVFVFTELHAKQKAKKPQILIVQKFRGKLNQTQLLHLNCNSRRLREHNRKIELAEQMRILLSSPDSNTFLQIPSFYRISRKSIAKIQQTVLQIDHRQEAFKKGFFSSSELKKIGSHSGATRTQPRDPLNTFTFIYSLTFYTPRLHPGFTGHCSALCDGSIVFNCEQKRWEISI